MEEKLKKQVHEMLEQLVEQNNLVNNLNVISKLVDIHKDLSNEEYWKVKEEFMKYRYGNEYGNEYGARARDSRGRFTMGEYGRRYRGEEMVDAIKDTYRDYSEGREQYNRGNYGAKEDSMKSLEAMLESAFDFIAMLKRNATSQEETSLIQEYLRHISEL